MPRRGLKDSRALTTRAASCWRSSSGCCCSLAAWTAEEPSSEVEAAATGTPEADSLA